MITYEYKMKSYLWRRANRADVVTDKAPISLRIEIDGYPRAEFGTGVRASEAEWNHATQRLQPLRGMSKEDVQLQKSANAKLGQWLLQLEQAYNNFKSQGGDPSPADLREFLRGGRTRDHGRKTLLAMMEARYAFLVEKGSRPSTLRNMRKAINSVSAFLTRTRAVSLPAENAKRAWCRQIEQWMIALPLAGSTIRLYMIQLFAALEQAVDDGVLEANPTAGYRFRSQDTKPGKRHLCEAEVQRLAGWVFTDEALRNACRAFVFCCYTGLSYVDYVRFAKNPDAYICSEPLPDGRLAKGFRLSRQKLGAKGKEQWYPLFPEANEMLDLLPVYSSAHLNQLLKQIAAEVGLSLPDLRHKDSRSTFAQIMRDRFELEVSTKLAGHTEAVADKFYSSDNAKILLKKLVVLGAELTYN